MFNGFATYVREPDWYAKIEHVDGIFAKAAANLVDPQHVFAAFLLVRCHSSYRAAARLAISTQVPEAYNLLRSTLEYGAYGVLLEGSQALTDIWLRRNESEQDKKNARQNITWGAARSAVKARDSSSKLGPAVETLYDRCLSYGAHPNEDAVFSNMNMTGLADGGLSFKLNYLSSDPLTVRTCLKSTVQVGFAALRIWQLVFPERFALLLLDDELDDIGKSGI